MEYIKIEVTIDSVLEMLQGDELQEKWNEVLSEWHPENPADVEAVKNRVMNLAKSHYEMMSKIDSESDLSRAVALLFIELKSFWINLNTQIQYSMFGMGSAPEKLVYMGSLTGILISFVERLLAQDTISKINEFLGSVTAELNDKVDPHQMIFSMEEQLNAVYREKLQLQNALGTSEPSSISDMIESLTDQLNLMYATSISKSDLVEKTGVDDLVHLAAMIESLTDQLELMYKELNEATIIENGTISISGPKKIIVRGKRA